MEELKSKKTKDWEIEGIEISYNALEFSAPCRISSQQQDDRVRMHFGLMGKYSFDCAQLPVGYRLSGAHNNIMYTNGLDLDINCESVVIQTFGVNFTPQVFVEIASNGSDLLKRFSERILKGEDSLLSPKWASSTLRIQQVVEDIIYTPFSDELQNIFLTAKSMELLVLTAEQHEKYLSSPQARSRQDHQRLVHAKEILTNRVENPPTTRELSKLVGLNEYKLKKGFYELFNSSIFGYVLEKRMHAAIRLLLDSDKLVKEIGYEVGYSTPQHFSTAFKKKFGRSPKAVRNNPDVASAILKGALS